MTGEIISAITKRLPDMVLSTSAENRVEYGRDWTRFWAPDPLAVAFPESTEQVRDLVRLARELRLPLVPSGGRTGLSGGAVAARGELVVSLQRMRGILDFDPIDRSVRVQAGVVTGQLQEFARQQGLYYPVEFAADGSSQIGGNIATNAGGVKVLRYGLTRDWVAGLTVVTGRGEVLELNRGLIKNASGYDLRHLLIGSEGTLGIVVEAVMQLTQPPPTQAVMLLGLSGLTALMPVLGLCRERGLKLSAFEFFTDLALNQVCQHRGLASPMDNPCPYYALVEFDNPDDIASETALAVFEQGMEQGWVADGVMSQSEAQAEELWQYREGISEAISQHTPYKNDISIRISRIPGFLDELDQLVAQAYPEFQVVWFGHIGDGNLHMNVLKPEHMDIEGFQQACQSVNQKVFSLVRQYGGSISAEHGIGLLKQPYLDYVHSPATVAAMRAVKSALDPAGIMNPGKLLPEDSV